MRKWYLITAGIVSAVATVGQVSLFAQGRLQPHESLQLHDLVILLLIGTWLVTDPTFPADKRPSFDHAMLLWITYPLFALYQLFTTRRWRGVLILLGLALLDIVPNAAPLVYYLAN